MDRDERTEMEKNSLLGMFRISTISIISSEVLQGNNLLY